MKYEDWLKVRITQANVLAYLHHVLRAQNAEPDRDIMRLVKQDGGLIYKAYSAKTRRVLTETMKQQIPFYRIVASHEPYAGSIESNQMQMVLAKEKLNLFMKGQNVDLDEIYERFGVDYD